MSRGGPFPRNRDRIFTQLERDLARLAIVEVSPEVVEAVPQLASAHPLKSLDAIHLASCLLLARGLPGQVELVCTDAFLSRAAGREGVAVGCGGTAAGCAV